MVKFVFAIVVGPKFAEDLEQKKVEEREKKRGGLGWFVTVKL